MNPFGFGGDIRRIIGANFNKIIDMRAQNAVAILKSAKMRDFEVVNTFFDDSKCSRHPKIIVQMLTGSVNFRRSQSSSPTRKMAVREAPRVLNGL